MRNIKQKLVELREKVISEEITIKTLQRTLSQLLLSSELPDIEKTVKKFDNDLELVIYTVTPSNHKESAVEIINRAIEYINRNVVN